MGRINLDHSETSTPFYARQSACPTFRTFACGYAAWVNNRVVHKQHLSCGCFIDNMCSNIWRSVGICRIHNCAGHHGDHCQREAQLVDDTLYNTAANVTDTSRRT